MSPRLFSIWGFGLLMIVAGLRAETFLVPQFLSVSPGVPVQVALLVTNDGSGTEAVRLPARLSGRLHGGDQSWNVVLESTDGDQEQTLEAGRFLRKTYVFPLPVGLTGPVVLEVSDMKAQPAMFTVQFSDLARTANAHVEARSDRKATAEHEAAQRRGTRTLAGVSAYEPVYFGVGPIDGFNAKFQISFKYQPVQQVPFFFAYTQTSLWDLHSTSKPFLDSAYRPAAFFLEENAVATEDRNWRVGWQAGFEHESNGRGGIDSRSINILFARPIFTWSPQPELKFTIAPKIYGYVDKEENPDIADFRGYADLRLGLAWRDWKTTATLRRGAENEHGSVQVDVVFPLRVTDDLLASLGVTGFNGYLFVQYFSGWGESILFYNQKHDTQVRAGLMIVP